MMPRKYDFKLIWKWHFEGMRQIQIARKLNCNPQSVANILHPRSNDTFMEKMKFMEQLKAGRFL